MRLCDHYYFYESDGWGSNSILIAGEPLTLVDTGTWGLEQLEAMLREDGFKLKDIGLIVHTHCHPDHVGMDAEIKKLAGAKILIHKKEAALLKVNTMLSVLPFMPKRFEVDGYLGDRLELGDVTLEVIHTPGHTPGSVCFYDRQRKLLISGDTLFPNGVGRCDLPGGNYRRLMESLKKLISLDIEYLLPGHMGCLTSKHAVEDSLQVVRELIEAELG